MIDLAERARQGHVSRGLYITIPEPQILEMVKSAGYDFARLDGEHVNFSAGTLENMFRTARLLDFPLQIRLGSMENLDALLALEPAAVMMPGIGKKKEAEAFVRRTKFLPLGHRGMYGFSDRIRFDGLSRKEYMEAANQYLHTIVQIESREGLDNLEAIVQVPGIDMISSGKADLSQALGMPGETTSPEIASAEERIVKTALKYGKVPTLYAETPERFHRLYAMGVRCFIIGFDCGICMEAMKNRRMQYCVESVCGSEKDK